MENHIDTLKGKVKDGFSEFIGKAIVYTLASSDLILNLDNGSLPELIEYVKSSIHKSFDDYLTAHIEIEVVAMESNEQPQ